jgi:orotate phosphoribosyltransferase
MSAIEEDGGFVAAIVSMIDRTGGVKLFDDIPFFSLGAINIETWEPQDCPLCKAGGIPVKPGSR